MRGFLVGVPCAAARRTTFRGTRVAPPGAVEVPPAAFTTPFGRAMWDKEPGRFRLVRLDAVRAAYAQAAERL